MGYAQPPETWEDLAKLVDEILAGRSRSYVSDAEVLARWIKNKAMPEMKAMLTNLTSTQTRCTELLQEARDLKAETRDLKAEVGDLKARLPALEGCGE